MGDSACTPQDQPLQAEEIRGVEHGLEGCLFDDQTLTVELRRLRSGPDRGSIRAIAMLQLALPRIIPC